jgi:hypothetical protein
LIPSILIKCSQHCFMYKCNITRSTSPPPNF